MKVIRHIGRAREYLVYESTDSLGVPYFILSKTSLGSGGYYNLESLVKIKGMTMRDVALQPLKES
jgi:hypothetical protein